MTKPTFDPEQSWSLLEDRIAKEKSPRRRALLEKVRDHMRTEIGGDHEGLMGTLSDDPQYHFWGTNIGGGPKGREEVSGFYKNMIEGGGNRFHFDMKRIVVDDNTVVTEGRMRNKMVGAVIIASGVQEVDGEPVDPEADYIAESQILTVWPATEDGQLIGEDIYFGSSLVDTVFRM